MKYKILIFLFWLLASPLGLAVEAVNPTGVNINGTGVTTAFLTFIGTEGEESSEAFWCGEINVPANTVSASNPCLAGTFFGFLPRGLNQSRQVSGNLTDVMTIPASVSRRAMQSAREGGNSSFFYVRKFIHNGVAQYIAVTCRMANGGARVPFALTEVNPWFEKDERKVAVHLLTQGDIPPPVRVALRYNGSGRLKARWEIVKPGDVLPKESDLLPEAALPVALRGLQKRYNVIANVDVFLPPTGETIIDGPDPRLLPNRALGPYQILLRVEATRDKEGNSTTGSVEDSGITAGGTAISGGVAGFAVPPLRYYVATEDAVSEALRNAGVEKSLSLLPAKVDPDGNVSLSWLNVDKAAYYSLEIRMEGEKIFRAIHRSGLIRYSPPPWVIEKISSHPRSEWRVSAFDLHGNRIARSDWRDVN